MMGSHSREASSKDLWLWQGSSKVFKTKLFYSHTFVSETFNPLLCWIWKSSCTLKIKVFAWILIMDKLNTKDMVERRHWHMEDGVHCKLCPLQTRESRHHLFFICNFSVGIWNYLQIDWSAGNSMSDLLFRQGEVLISLSSLKWCSLPAGISGSSEMPKFSEVRGQVSINGDVLLGMILV